MVVGSPELDGLGSVSYVCLENFIDSVFGEYRDLGVSEGLDMADKFHMISFQNALEPGLVFLGDRFEGVELLGQQFV